MKNKKRPIKKYRKNGVLNKEVRAMAFVDGFNLFHALKKCDARDRWCDIRKLIENQIADKNIKLGTIWWFTAYFNKKPNGVILHKQYAKALQSVKVQSFLGKYNSVEKVFYKKHHKIKYAKPNKNNIPDKICYFTEEEKKTDVNIAVKIIEEAFLDSYDIAYIVSGDSDLYSGINIAKRHFGEKRFINILPPLSKGRSIGSICDYQIVLRKGDVEKARFPDQVVLKNGEIIDIPQKYV